MDESSDMELLRAFARQGSHHAFAEIVHRHINLVYSVAWRYTGNAHEAQDVTQVVFIILAKKAARLRPNTILQGWLYETTRFTAAKFLRGNIRRQFREQEAHMQSSLDDPGSENIWQQLAPLLEEAMSHLGEQERAIVAMRFYQNKSGAEVAAALGVQEWAAHKRLSRAVEKLRAFFARRGITVSAGVLIAALAGHSVQAAPVGLASSIAATAAMKGLGVGASTSTLLKTTLKIMAWTKAKTTAVAAVIILLAAGGTTVAFKKIERHIYSSDSWQQQYFNSQVLSHAPPLVQILPAKYSHGGGYGSTYESGGGSKYMGYCVSAETLTESAYGSGATRTIVNTEIPAGKFDYIASLPRGNEDALKQKVREQFGLTAHSETREMDVLLLQVKTPDAPGLKRAARNSGSSMMSGSGRLTIKGQQIGSIAGYTEGCLQTPILDRTGLKGKFDIDLHWSEPHPMHPDYTQFRQLLTDQLGLELIPARENLKVLVIDKAE